MKPLLLLFLAVGALAHAESSVTPVGRLRLLDGRTLENVVIRSYDTRAAKVLVISNGKALLIPIDLIPPPFAERIKAESIEPTADLVQTTPVPPVPSSDYKPAPSPTTPPPPAPAPRPAPAAPPSELTNQRQAHLDVAKAHALRYFKYQFRTGSNSISVTDYDIEIDESVPVPGWNQYRTTGTVYIEVYDSVGGGSFSRRARKFEVLTEQKPGEDIKVIDFMRK